MSKLEVLDQLKTDWQGAYEAYQVARKGWKRGTFSYQAMKYCQATERKTWQLYRSAVEMFVAPLFA